MLESTDFLCEPSSKSCRLLAPRPCSPQGYFLTFFLPLALAFFLTGVIGLFLHAIF